MIDIEPPRHLGLEGASNFRDLGGYPTEDGRRVRWRHIFRSNHLGMLSEADLTRLKPIGLKKVIDFRGPDEINRHAPCRVRDADLHVNSIDPGISPRLHARLAAGDSLSGSDTAAIICDIYRNYLHAHADNFRLLFDHLLDENTPLVFHCAAGKDRTGIAAALILLALGVPRSVILDDYLLTGLHWKVDAEHKTDLPPEVAKVLVSVDAAFLHAAFKAIDEDFGGIENYLGEQLGIDPLRQERLRALYLEG